MTPRMRVIAGPNGSGKSTLARQLMTDYEVNLYTFLNADDLFREIQARLKTPCPFSTDPAELLSFVEQSTYPDQFKVFFRTGKISISEADYIVFSPDAVNSYTVAITADFFKEQYLARKMSFSFDNNVVDVNKLMNEILGKYSVRDITVAEPEIESIIQKMYNGEVL